MHYSKEDVAEAVARISERLNRPINEESQIEFEAGLYPNLLASERVGKSEIDIPVLEKYLMGALSYVRQPVTFYDIFRVCRCVNVVLNLDLSLIIHDKVQTENLEARLNRLVSEKNQERFDSTFFELVAAAGYAQISGVERVVFIKETPTKKTPDLLVVRGGSRDYFEFKKVERIKGHHMSVRNIVSNLLSPIVAQFQTRAISVTGEVIFHVDPNRVGNLEITSALNDALRTGTTIISNSFTATLRQIPGWDSSQAPMLYPSPAFLSSRYDFKVRSEWFGIVHQILANFGHWEWTPEKLRHGQSSWLNSVDWDSGIRWRIDHEETINRYRRFAFNNVFDALTQLKEASNDAGIHIWVESDYFLQGRRDILLDLFQRLKTNQRDRFSWIVVNETLVDVSPLGNFDLIEHAHMIQGPAASTRIPPVSSLFTVPDGDGGAGEFGVGRSLPDIDAEL